MEGENFIVVSFGTKGTHDKFVEPFKKHMKDLGLKYDVEVIEPLDPPNPKVYPRLEKKKQHLKVNGRYRSEFLIEKLYEHDKTIVWIDCDDGFSKTPIIPKTLKYDVGFVKSNTASKHRLDVIAGIIVIRPTENGLHFLQVWNYLNSWEELEPVGGSHIRLCMARNICFGKESRNIHNMKQANMTPYFLSIWKQNLIKERLKK